MYTSWGTPVPGMIKKSTQILQGPVSQRVTINRTIDINRNSMANRVSRKLAINRKPLWNGGPDIEVHVLKKQDSSTR